MRLLTIGDIIKKNTPEELLFIKIHNKKEAMVFANASLFYFFAVYMFIDNWTLTPVCVSTIGDIIDCRDTYEKVRVFSCF